MGMNLLTWFKMLIDQRGRIHPVFFLRTFVLFLTAIGNLPLQCWEYLRFAAKIKKQEVNQPLFILGHPRSGTTHLHYLLSKDPQFAYCSVYDAIVPHIFLSGGKWMEKMIASSLPPTRPQDEVSMSIDAPKEEEFALATTSGLSYMNCFYFPSSAMRNFERSVLFSDTADKLYWQKHFRNFLHKLSWKYNGKKLLLKSPANTGRVGEILELFPDACFVHISRHPYEVYLSTLRLFEKIVPITAFQKPDAKQLEDFIIASYRLMYEKYAKAKKKVPQAQFVEVRYEDLLHDPQGILTSIYSAIGLELSEEARFGFEKELERTQDYHRNKYTALSAELKERIRKEWAIGFDLFGYSA